MLSLNPKNRPTISTILEKPFIKKKVANYIYDFIKNSNNNFHNFSEVDRELYMEQCEILKEQAEKLGVFNLIVNDLNGNLSNKDKIFLNDDNEMNIIKGIDNLKSESIKPDENYYSNEYDETAPVRYDIYLRRKRQEKIKIEVKLEELERKKKLILDKVKNRIENNILRENILSVGNNKINPIIVNRNINKISSAYNSNSNTNAIDKKQLNTKLNNSLLHKDKNNLFNRPETGSKNYRSNRKISDGDIEKEKEGILMSQLKKKIIKDQKDSKSPEALRNIRPFTGVIHKQKNNNLAEIDLLNILETISEENDEDLKIEKNNLRKVRQEIDKMKECLEQTQIKIERAVQKIYHNENNDNNKVNFNKDNKNKNNTPEIKNNYNANNAIQKVIFNSENEENYENSENDDNYNYGLNNQENNKVKSIESLVKDDGSNMIKEKIRQFRQYIQIIYYIVT